MFPSTSGLQSMTSAKPRAGAHYNEPCGPSKGLGQSFIELFDALRAMALN
jgi:hypothetical protein